MSTEQKRKPLTGEVWSRVVAVVGKDQAKQILPMWNEAMAIVAKEYGRRAKIEVLEELTREIKDGNGKAITTVSQATAERLLK